MDHSVLSDKEMSLEDVPKEDIITNIKVLDIKNEGNEEMADTVIFDDNNNMLDLDI